MAGFLDGSYFCLSTNLYQVSWFRVDLEFSLTTPGDPVSWTNEQMIELDQVYQEQVKRVSLNLSWQKKNKSKLYTQVRENYKDHGAISHSAAGAQAAISYPRVLVCDCVELATPYTSIIKENQSLLEAVVYKSSLTEHKSSQSCFIVIPDYWLFMRETKHPVVSFCWREVLHCKGSFKWVTLHFIRFHLECSGLKRIGKCFVVVVILCFFMPCYLTFNVYLKCLNTFDNKICSWLGLYHLLYHFILSSMEER